MTNASILHIQMCLLLGEGSCGLDGARECPFCDTKEHSNTSYQNLPLREVFDDSALPWWNKSGVRVAEHTVDNQTRGLIYD